jgi:hypothetical protein
MLDITDKTEVKSNKLINYIYSAINLESDIPDRYV